MNEFVFDPRYPNEITAKRSQIGRLPKSLSSSSPVVKRDYEPLRVARSKEEEENYSRELRASLSRALTSLSISAHRRFDKEEADSLGR